METVGNPPEPTLLKLEKVPEWVVGKADSPKPMS